MKKLNKSSVVVDNSLVAYSVVCDSCNLCTCTCTCVPDPIHPNLTASVVAFTSPSTTRLTHNNANKGMNVSP